MQWIKTTMTASLMIAAGFSLPALIFNGQSALANSQKNPQTSESCGFTQNIYGERISWKSEKVITFVLHESVPMKAIPAIQRAMQTWDKTLGRKVFELVPAAGGSSDKIAKKDHQNVIYWFGAGEWDHAKKEEQARTHVYWEGAQIIEADMRINSDTVSYYFDKPLEAGQVDLESVILHELGHVLGFAHQDSRVSIMESVLPVQTERRDLFKEDVDSVKCEYFVKR
jgi:hypothetical protein